MFLAPSLTAFKQDFSDRLAAMLKPDALGAYILVLANSLQSDDLHQGLSSSLHANFSELKSAYENGQIKAPPDDVAVFEKILAINPEKLALTHHVEAGDWLLLLNVLRSLRPARAARQVITDLRQAFNTDGFHFNKAFLQPEIFWQGEVGSFQLRVLYNKFPLAPYHLLVVPNPEQELPQYLTREYHQMAGELVKQAQKSLPGLYLGYNSLGAYASVNHLHFHAVLRDREFPVEREGWSHRGGAREYPLTLRMFESINDSWAYIEHLHLVGQTYNVLYTHYGIYLLVRKAQNTVELPACLLGAGWPELCGEITFSKTPDDIDAVATDIAEGLRLLSVRI